METNQEYVEIGGWTFTKEEGNIYSEKREAMMEYLQLKCSELFETVVIDGKDSQDGDYLSAYNEEKDEESIFIQFSPEEVEVFQSFDTKEEYLDMKRYLSKVDHHYNTSGIGEDNEEEDSYSHWFNYMKKSYEDKFGKDYPYSV